jgi:hypothetical protein
MRISSKFYSIVKFFFHYVKFGFFNSNVAQGESSGKRVAREDNHHIWNTCNNHLVDMDVRSLLV